MKAAGRNDDMLSVYTFNASHDVAEILIGYRGTSVQNSIGLCYMGFHFMSDGSVWMGNTSTRRFTGSLIHFRNDGCIDCGNYENGELIETLDIQNIIDNYYGTYSFENGDLFESLMFDMKPNHEREVFRNIPSIIKEYNYLMGYQQPPPMILVIAKKINVRWHIMLVKWISKQMETLNHLKRKFGQSTVNPLFLNMEF